MKKVIIEFVGKRKPKLGYRYWIVRNIWIVLIVTLLIFWIITWILSDWASPRLNTMASITSAVGIVGLGVLTYIFFRYMKDLAESTKSQADATISKVILGD